MRRAVRTLWSLILITLYAVAGRAQGVETQTFIITCNAQGQIYVGGALTPLEELTGLLEQRASQLPPGGRWQWEVHAHQGAPPKAVEAAVQAATARVQNRPHSVNMNKSADRQTAVWTIYELPPKPEAGGMPTSSPAPKGDPQRPAGGGATDRVRPLRLGGDVLQSKLIKKVEPTYPEWAKRNQVSGLVLLSVTIDEQGHMQSVQLIRGHPGLNVAAMVAVAQWEYAPTKLNGEPVPVEANVTVNFVLR